MLGRTTYLANYSLRAARESCMQSWGYFLCVAGLPQIDWNTWIALHTMHQNEDALKALWPLASGAACFCLLAGCCNLQVASSRSSVPKPNGAYLPSSAQRFRHNQPTQGTDAAAAQEASCLSIHGRLFIPSCPVAFPHSPICATAAHQTPAALGIFPSMLRWYQQ